MKACTACVCIRRKEWVFKIQSTADLFSLMSLYLSEWQHRDSLFWKQIFAYFFASLFVMVLPFMKPEEIDLSAVFPDHIFPLIGMVMSILFWFVCRAYIDRMQVLSNKYQELINLLPYNYRRKTVKEHQPGMAGTLLSVSVMKFICCIMFIALIMIGCILFFLANIHIVRG